MKPCPVAPAVSAAGAFQSGFNPCGTLKLALADRGPESPRLSLPRNRPLGKGSSRRSAVPEALHLAVRTTRYTNGVHTTTFPKQAFVLLHAKYPESSWAAATPYWY